MGAPGKEGLIGPKVRASVQWAPGRRGRGPGAQERDAVGLGHWLVLGLRGGV